MQCPECLGLGIDPDEICLICECCEECCSGHDTDEEEAEEALVENILEDEDDVYTANAW